MTYQLEVNESTLNEFQTIKTRDSIARYLPELLITPNKIISSFLKNLNSLRPVYRIISSLNLIFILVILTLTSISARAWMYPDYPSRVDGKSKNSSSREVTRLTISRQSLKPQNVDEVVTNNLFRKERDEYQPPALAEPEPLSKVTQKSNLPPPELTLRGVMLLGNIKVCILEGSHSVTIDGKAENTPIKRKGYRLGDKISDYKISKITKKEVTLDNSAGQIIKLKLKSSMSGTDEVSKPKQPKTDKKSKIKQPKSNIISTQPVTKKRPKPTPRISGTRLTPLPNHISGM